MVENVNWNIEDNIALRCVDLINIPVCIYEICMLNVVKIEVKIIEIKEWQWKKNNEQMNKWMNERNV